MRLTQERIDVHRDGLADASYVAELGDQVLGALVSRGGAQRGERAVLRGDRLRERGADVRDAERGQQPRERRRCLRVRDRLDQVLGRQLREPLEAEELVDGQREQVGEVDHEAGFEELRDDLLAEAVDVHLVPRCEELDRTEPLGRAADPVRAHEDHPALLAHELRLARRARGRWRDQVARRRDRDVQDLRNDLASLLDGDAIADPQAQAGDLVPVVNRRPRDGRPRDVDRIEDRDRGHGTRAPDIELDLAQDGGDLARRKLVRDRPARKLGGRPEGGALRKIVDLHDESIDLVRQRIAAVRPRVNLLDQLLPALRPGVLRRGRDPELLDERERCGVSARVALAIDHLVQDRPHRSLRDFTRILLLDRARRGVAWVLEQLFAVLRTLGVDRLELGLGHVDLAAHDDIDRLAELERDPLHALHICRDVFPDAPVATGRAEHELTLLVCQLDAEAVDLGLDREHRHVPVEAFDHPVIERAQVRLVVGVVEREHRDRSRDLRELRDRRMANALRGRPHDDPVRVLALDLTELAVQPVVFTITDRRIRFDVVAPVVLGQLVDQSEVVLPRHDTREGTTACH